MSECPLPSDSSECVTLAHGGGGVASQRLLEQLFYPAFANPLLDQRHDGAMFDVGEGRLAFTTDMHVIRPLFFPGGDIGALSVIGTLNDLAMCGAAPHSLSASFVLEEGLPLATLRRVIDSMAAASKAAGAVIATGDTKVVERGAADGLYISCSGIGICRVGSEIGPHRIAVGDVLLVSGDIGRHGMAVMAAREAFAIEGLESDLGLLWPQVAALFDAGIDIRCLRDLTRGGLAAAVSELASTAGVGVRIDETAVPVDAGVQSAAEILGLEPMHLACEGRMLAVVPEREAERTLEVLQDFDTAAAHIGRFTRQQDLILEGAYGGERMLVLPAGELLPRIC